MANRIQDIKGARTRAKFDSHASIFSNAFSPRLDDAISHRAAQSATVFAVPAHSDSSQKTHEALLALDDWPSDTSALETLWQENHLVFESQMRRHLNQPHTPALLRRVLSGVVSHCRFYSHEIDDPRVWVARCVNLETRRLALQLAR